MRLLLVGVVTAIVISGTGSAKADFTLGTPKNLSQPVNSSFYERLSCISYDGLEMYIDSGRPGQGGWDIWVSRRATTDDEWGTPENLGPTINSSAADMYASISVDGLTLYFSSDRPDGYGGADIYMITRPTREAPWGAPMNLGPSVSSDGSQWGPWITADDLTLYYSQFDTYGAMDIMVTRRTTVNEPWGEPTNLGPVVNSEYFEHSSSLSDDGLLLFFSEHYWGFRPDGYGGNDIWFTKRSSINDPWGAPVNLGPNVNTPREESNGRVSRDGRTLYFSSDRLGGLGGWDIWQAPILPIVDFDADSSVGLNDLLMLIESWGTDDPQCDIGPMAWGDGVVDEADLEVLMGYWGIDVAPPYDLRCASNPNPVNGPTIDVEEALYLSWRPGRNAAQHDVYLGTDPMAVEDADISDTTGIYLGRQEANDYTPPEELEFGRTYFWRVDEVNTDGSISKGQLWSFIVADVVDDFEGYDAGENEIWFTWHDGLGYGFGTANYFAGNGTGSAVGNETTASFTEESIVHGGYQSMPFYYDNGTALTSEATREWEEPQDWTRRGVESLTLWYHGDLTNDPEPMYVMLQDSADNSAAVIHPDIAATTTDAWQEWSIALKDFTGVDLQSIKKMSIGIGDRASTDPGGSGVLYIDDIGLHLPATQ